MLSRNVWSARVLGLRPPPGEASEPGLILIQIDGLSRTQFEKAVKAGRLPFISRLIRYGHFTLESFYSGVPSTTPAVQGELFFGVKTAVPAFHFLRREAGVDFKMFQAESAIAVEEELLAACPEPTLEGGSAYSNIYRGGASFTRYCSRDFAPGEIFKRVQIFKWLFFAIIYAPKLVRMTALALLEFFIALLDAVRGLYERQDFLKELAFVPARIAVCVVLREAIRFRVLLDIEKGTRVIHANFLGYDEQAHRRGPDSAFAHWSLKAIDRAIRDIYKAANASGYRDYELMLYSDHGQEKTTPYAKARGRELEAALAGIFEKSSVAEQPIWVRRMPELVGATVERWRSLFGLNEKPSATAMKPDPANQIVVTAMGPVGHIYFPQVPSRDELESLAERCVSEAEIPMVMVPSENGTAMVFNSRGTWSLPRDAAEVIGTAHPFLEEAAEDLVRLCSHKDAGDIVISGWDPEKPPITFPSENGAHGGPGSEETRGFLLVPDRIRRWHVAHLENTRQRVRGEDLRKIVKHYLGRDGEREERTQQPSSKEKRTNLRVMCYNIHSCIGIDGRIRPERVARVINHFDPDIVAVQEVDCHRPRTASHDQSHVICEHLRMHHVFHAMFEEKSERYGIAIFSKFPLEVVKSGYLTDAIPAKFREARGAIWVKLKVEGRGEFHFINTHFGLGKVERLTQVKEILGKDWLGAIPEDEPVILCGDLNSGPGSMVIKLLGTRLRDVQHLLPGHRPKSTFTSIKPFRRIDHVFVSGHFKVESIDVPETSTARVASDHLPLCVELSIRKDDD